MNSQLDPDGVWRPAIPLPFYISARRWRWLPFPRRWLHQCWEVEDGQRCNRTYFEEDDYRIHWRKRHDHTLAGRNGGW